jgi:tetratricopeptide (TPR) repeat protein
MRLVLALVSLSLFASNALAQVSDDERARTHFEAGRSYYEQARYDDSAREFQEAFALSGRPALLLNLSQAYERGLHFDAAIAELQHYLQLVPDAPDRKTHEERIARLQELQARMQQQPAGAAPAPAPAPGAQPAPAPAPAPVASAPPPPPPSAAPAPAPAEEKSSLATPGWILVGTGGAVLLGSVITGVIAHGKHSDLAKQCSGGKCPPSAQSDIDSGKTMATVSTVMLVVGVLAGGAGAVLLIMDASHGSNETAHAARAGDVQLAAGPGQLGLGAQVAF